MTYMFVAKVYLPNLLRQEKVDLHKNLLTIQSFF